MVILRLFLVILGFNIFIINRSVEEDHGESESTAKGARSQIVVLSR